MNFIEFMKNHIVFFLKSTFVAMISVFAIQSFAYDANRCSPILIDPSSARELALKGALLNELAGKLALEVKSAKNYKEANMLAPIVMAASQAQLSSVVIYEFSQLAKVDFFSTNKEDSIDTHKLILNSLNVFMGTNDSFLKDLKATISSSVNYKITNTLEEVFSNLNQINLFLAPCRK